VASNVGKDSTFVAHMIDLFETNNFWFSEDLEGVDFGVELVIKGDMRGCGGTDKTDSGKGSGP
jgi:hypothetical protein